MKIPLLYAGNRAVFDGIVISLLSATRYCLYPLDVYLLTMDLRDRDPLANCKIKKTMTFSFPLTDGERSRLYSSFAVVFNDGSLLNSGTFYMISNPELLANRAPLLQWSNAPKGLVLGTPDDAVALGASQGMIKIPLSALSDGEAQISGTEYYVSANTLSTLTQQIKDAASAGMQVSLTLIADQMHPAAKLAVLIDHIVEQCTADGVGISSIFVERTDSVTALQLATICRFVHMALTSRVVGSRIFVVSDHTLLADAVSFFTEVAGALNAGSPIAWGAAIKLQETEKAPWVAPESQEGLDLLVANFDQLQKHLNELESPLAPKWLAVCDLAYSAEDETRQAASFAYAYRALCEKGASLIFYAAQQEDTVGLYAQDGTPRRIVSVFSDIDTGLNAADITLCREQAGDSWSNLTESASHPLLGGVASTEYDAGGEILFDFSDHASHGFAYVGGAGTPAFEPTAGFGVTIDPATSLSRGGIRKVMDRAEALENATMLTVSASVGADTERAVLTLTLEGVNKDGARIVYRSSASVACKNTASVAFHINSFASQIDPDAPVVMTLTAAPEGGISLPFPLEVNEIRISHLEKDTSMLLPLILIPTCILLTAVVLLLIYRRATAQTKRNRRPAKSADQPTNQQ